MPIWIIPITVIVLGAALLFEGGAIAARFSDILAATSKGRYDASELGAGMTAEVVGGFAGLITGILALLNVYPMVLTPVAAIVYGVTLLFGSGVAARLNSLEIAKSPEYETFREVAREAVSAAASVQLLLGIATITLGILALVGINPMTLILVALLCVGLSSLLNGTAISARMLSFVRS